ncbi:hypothetical protein [Hominenteromicrobium sp.]
MIPTEMFFSSTNDAEYSSPTPHSPALFHRRPAISRQFPKLPRNPFLCVHAGPHPREALRFSAFVCDTITPRQQDNVNTFFTPFEAGPRAEQARIRARFAADAHRPKAPHFAGFHAVDIHVVYYSYF